MQKCEYAIFLDHAIIHDINHEIYSFQQKNKGETSYSIKNSNESENVIYS